MAEDQRAVSLLKTILPLHKSGINFVCSECGALLYHIGLDGPFENGGIMPSRQPSEIAGRLNSCPECGHRLNPEPKTIRVAVSNSTKNLQPR